jgi:hypothetical protein
MVIDIVTVPDKTLLTVNVRVAETDFVAIGEVDIEGVTLGRSVFVAVTPTVEDSLLTLDAVNETERVLVSEWRVVESAMVEVSIEGDNDDDNEGESDAVCVSLEVNATLRDNDDV